MHESVRKALDFSAKVSQNSEREAIFNLMKHIKFPRPYREQLTRVTNEMGWSVAAFHAAFPNFPFTLLVRPKAKMKELLRFDQLFAAKKRSKLVRELLDAVEAADSVFTDRMVVLLLKVPFCEDWVAIHNGAECRRVEYVQVRLPLDNGNPVIMEPVASLVENYREYFAGYFENGLDISGTV